MHTAPSLIAFTTLSGLGFGMLAWLGLDVPAPRGWTAFALFAVAFAAAGGGLVASVFHLGHPERAPKAFTQWRSSWLSREAWAATITLGLAAVYAVGLVFFDARWRLFGAASGAMALATVFATSMIYMQMRTVPRWNHWSPPALFLAWSVAGGALMTGRVVPATLLLLATGVLQVAAWADQTRRERVSDTDTGTATGLGGIGAVRPFEPPHTEENYLTKEMVFRVGRKHAAALRVIALALASVLPAALLWLPFGHIAAGAAALSHVAGVAVQRWLFFAEARHVVAYYYPR